MRGREYLIRYKETGHLNITMVPPCSELIGGPHMCLCTNEDPNNLIYSYGVDCPNHSVYGKLLLFSLHHGGVWWVSESCCTVVSKTIEDLLSVEDVKILKELNNE